MRESSLSHHAERRANQRGVPHFIIEVLLAQADIELPVGNGCSALRLSKTRLQDRELRENLGADLDRLAGLAVICADDTGEIVTVLHDWGGTDGRRYRRVH